MVAIGSLALADLEAGEPHSAARLLARLEPLRAVMPENPSLLRLLWLDARVSSQIGASSRAVGLLTFLHRRFHALEMLYDTALAALDLAAVYAQRGEHAKVCALAQEMLPVFSSQKIRREARQALALWADAALKQGVSLDEIRATAARVERLRARRR